mgnify:CR=1 FL=1
MLKNKKSLLKICLVALMILSTIVVFTGCGKENKKNNENTELAYEEPLKDYFDGIKNRDIGSILKAFPDFMEMSNNITENDINDLYSQYEELYGSNIKIDYELGTATNISEEDIADLKEQIKEIYQDLGDVDITEGYTVPVTVTITGDGNTENTNEESSENNEDNNSNKNVEENNFYVLKYNGNWYLM